MAAAINPELVALRDRIVITIQYLDDVDDLGEFADAVVRQTEACFSKGKLGPLKLIANQIDSFTVALNMQQRDGLDAILGARLGVDRDAERASREHYLACVIASGRIASAKQRRKIEEYLERLESENGDPALIQEIAKLLSA